MFELDQAIQQVVRQSLQDILLVDDLLARLEKEFPAIHRIEESNLLTAVSQLFKKNIKRRVKHKEKGLIPVKHLNAVRLSNVRHGKIRYVFLGDFMNIFH